MKMKSLYATTTTLFLFALVVAATILISSEEVSSSLAKKRTLWFELEEYTFEKYTKEFNKIYTTDEEYSLRKTLFEQKLAQIRKHNQDPTKRWKKGVNHLSDRTEKEFRRLLGYDKSLGFASMERRQQQEVFVNNKAQWLNKLVDVPTSVDWREKGIISDVKDQGQCGSCWTFGTAETVESHWAIQSGELQDLSEQQILDCTDNSDDCGGSGGCEGGTPEIAYQKIISLGGLSSEWTYPYLSYHGKDFPQCLYNASLTVPVASPTSYVVLPSNQYDPVITTLATVGPLAINVDASAWSDYESGVFDGCNATNPDIDHVVQLVGYGTDDVDGDYWLIRNSWSPKWGELGYIRLARSSTPTCGVDLNPQDGDGCNGGPSTVTVCGECALLYDVSYPTF